MFSKIFKGMVSDYTNLLTNMLELLILIKSKLHVSLITFEHLMGIAKKFNNFQKDTKYKYLPLLRDC